MSHLIVSWALAVCPQACVSGPLGVVPVPVAVVAEPVAARAEAAEGRAPVIAKQDGPSDAEREWARAFQSGQEALQGGDLRRASRFFETATEIARDEMDDLRRLGLSAQVWGDVLSEMERHAQAADAFRVSIDALTEAFDAENPAVGGAAMKLGRELVELGEWAEAEAALDAALVALAGGDERVAQDLAFTHFYRLRALDAQEKLEETAAAVEGALESLDGVLPEGHPLWGYFYNARGYAYDALADRDPEAPYRALEAYEASVQWHIDSVGDDPSTAEAILGLARAQETVRAYGDAIESYTDAIDRMEDQLDASGQTRLAYAYAGLASLHEQTHDYPAAIDAMRASVDAAAEGDDASAHIRIVSGLAGLYQRAGLLAEGIAVLEGELEEVGDDEEGQRSAAMMRATLAELLGDRLMGDDETRALALLDEAGATLRAAADEDGAWGGRWVAVTRASFLLDRGRFDESIAAYEEAIAWLESLGEDGADRLPEVYGGLAMALTRRGDAEGAVAAARQHLKLVGRRDGERSPASASARARLAGVLSDLGDVQAAVATYAEVIEQLEAMGPAGENDLAWTLFSYGRELFNAGDYAASLEALGRSYELDADDYAALFVAAGHLRLGQTDEAEAFLEGHIESRTARPGEDWSGRLLSLMAGDVSSDELRQVARDAGGHTEQRWLCELYFYAAVRSIAEGHEAAATKYLRACVDTNVYRFIEWESAQRLLERLGEAVPAGE